MISFGPQRFYAAFVDTAPTRPPRWQDYRDRAGELVRTEFLRELPRRVVPATLVALRTIRAPTQAGALTTDRLDTRRHVLAIETEQYADALRTHGTAAWALLLCVEHELSIRFERPDGGSLKSAWRAAESAETRLYLIGAVPLAALADVVDYGLDTFEVDGDTIRERVVTCTPHTHSLRALPAAAAAGDDASVPDRPALLRLEDTEAREMRWPPPCAVRRHLDVLCARSTEAEHAEDTGGSVAYTALLCVMACLVCTVGCGGDVAHPAVEAWIALEKSALVRRVRQRGPVSARRVWLARVRAPHDERLDYVTLLCDALERDLGRACERATRHAAKLATDQRLRALANHCIATLWAHYECETASVLPAEEDAL